VQDIDCSLHMVYPKAIPWVSIPLSTPKSLSRQRPTTVVHAARYATPCSTVTAVLLANAVTGSADGCSVPAVLGTARSASNTVHQRSCVRRHGSTRYVACRQNAHGSRPACEASVCSTIPRQYCPGDQRSICQRSTARPRNSVQGTHHAPTSRSTLLGISSRPKNHMRGHHQRATVYGETRCVMLYTARCQSASTIYASRYKASNIRLREAKGQKVWGAVIGLYSLSHLLCSPSATAQARLERQRSTSGTPVMTHPLRPPAGSGHYAGVISA